MEFDNSYYKIISKLFEQNNNLILIGAGGTGKSTNIGMIEKEYASKGRIIVKTAPTGIAAHNIGGITINSFLKFGDTNSIEEYNVYMQHKIDNENFNIERYEYQLKQNVSQTELLIIDEVSMISAEKWELIDYLLKEYDFNGKIILSGDIFQLAPISAPSKYLENNPKTDGRFFFDSPIWKQYKFVPYILEEVKRTKDKEFIEILHRIRTGDVTQNDISYLQQMQENEHIYNNNPTILASDNKFVFEYNRSKLQEIREEMCVIEYESEIVMSGHKREIINITNLNKDIETYVMKNLMVEKKLFLKVGALIVFVSNSDDKGLPFVNGDKGIITDIQEGYLRIRKIGQKDDEDDLVIPKMNYPYYDYIDGKFTLVANILQFPVKLGWALTIHKSQSLTLDNIVLDINKIFANGQFYVGISRAINPKNIYIKYDKNKYMFGHDIKKYTIPNKNAKSFYLRAKEISKIFQDRLEFNN